MKYFNFSTIKTFIIAIILPCFAISFISCEDESEDDIPVQNLVVPESAYSFTVTSVNNETETIVFAEPTFTDNFEILGCEVKKVIYYVDNNLASTETQSPFKLEYKTNSLSAGTHILKAIFTVSGENFNEVTVECKKEFQVKSSSSEGLPAVDFTFDYDHYVRVGDKIHASVTMNDRYNAGYKLNKVEFYFDGTLIKSLDASPYEIEFSADLEVGSSHFISASVYYSLGSNSSSSYSLSGNVTVLNDDETRYLFVPHFYSNISYSNGDVISGTGLLYKGKGDDSPYELNLYWDDDLVGTSKTFPYKFNYTINNSSVGIHRLKYEWVEYDKDGNYKGKSSQSSTFTIKQ
jgi:hypothetical protein